MQELDTTATATVAIPNRTALFSDMMIGSFQISSI
jgi:hypothetical protein